VWPERLYFQVSAGRSPMSRQKSLNLAFPAPDPDVADPPLMCRVSLSVSETFLPFKERIAPFFLPVLPADFLLLFMFWLLSNHVGKCGKPTARHRIQSNKGPRSPANVTVIVAPCRGPVDKIISRNHKVFRHLQTQGQAAANLRVYRRSPEVPRKMTQRMGSMPQAWASGAAATA
jgi:hypothetical protein